MSKIIEEYNKSYRGNVKKRWIEHYLYTERGGRIKLYPFQEKIICDRNDKKQGRCKRQNGATTLLLADAIATALVFEEKECIIYVPYMSQRNHVYRRLIAMLDNSNIERAAVTSNTISFNNQSHIRFVNDKENMRGLRPDALFIDDSSYINSTFLSNITNRSEYVLAMTTHTDPI